MQTQTNEEVSRAKVRTQYGIEETLILTETQPAYFAWNKLKSLAKRGDQRAIFVVDMINSGQLRLHDVIGGPALHELFVQVRDEVQQRNGRGAPDRETINR